MEPHDRLARRVCCDGMGRAGRTKASPKGLRHGFGVAAVSAGIPLLQKWLGHTQMGSVGDASDNAMCERFFATFECELLDRCRFKTQAEASPASTQDTNSAASCSTNPIPGLFG